MRYYTILSLIFSFGCFAQNKFKSVIITGESASGAVYLDSNKQVKSSSTVSDTELGYLDGVTSSIQTQLTGKVSGVASSVDGEIVLFDSTTGKLVKRATGSGFVKATSGVYSTSSQVDLTSDVTGTLPVASGGSGAATFTTNNVLLGNGTSAFQVVAPGTSGNVLTSNGTTWTSSAPSSGSAVYSATIDDNGGVTNEKPSNWITGDCSEDGGSPFRITCTLEAVFGATPNCTITLIESGSVIRGGMWNPVSSTSFSYTRTAAGSLSAAGSVGVVCQ